MCVSLQALKADIEVKCAAVKNEVQGEIDRVKEHLQHSDNVARELVDTVIKMGDRLSAVEAGSVQDNDAVKHLADMVSAVKLSGDSGQQALRDLLSVKIEPEPGEDDAESVASWPHSSATIASQPVGLGAGWPCHNLTLTPPLNQASPLPRHTLFLLLLLASEAM